MRLKRVVSARAAAYRLTGSTTRPKCRCPVQTTEPDFIRKSFLSCFERERKEEDAQNCLSNLDDRQAMKMRRAAHGNALILKTHAASLSSSSMKLLCSSECCLL